MHLKDYYSILEVETSATVQEIKKAYRRLAQQLHPDKNNNDPWSAARFTEVKEAYEVLTNPAKKEYYLQQRWYNQSTGRKKTQDVINPVNVLKQALELERYVSTLDVFRMDKQGLQDYMLEILSDPTIEQLKKFDEPGMIRETVSIILKAMHPLPKAFHDPILAQLRKLAAADNTALQLLNDFAARAAGKHRREKYSLILIIAATVILCILIWLAGS
jgi:molecular chaperone DnaJ